MKLLLSRHTLSFLTFVLLGITTTLTFSAAKQSSSIEWDSPFSSTTGYFYAIGMCKGTTDKTRKVGFIGSAEGAIHRTLDGVNWHRVAQFYTSLYWYGIYCFPDAQRVLAVGFSDGGDMDSGAIIAWSFNGGRNWTNPQLMPDTGELTNLQAVHFYNDTHGIILPSIQDSTPSLIYYTSNGGKNASDWKAVQVPGVFLQWYQSHPIRVFDGVTKTFAQADAGSQYCWSDDAGLSWKCDSLDQPVLIGSFVSSKEAIGVGGHTQVYSSRDGGRAWTRTSALPADLSNALVLPTDMVWIDDSDVVILIGGNDYPDYVGTVTHSTDRGITWVESMPQLPPTMFSSLDWVVTSPTTADVWAVGMYESDQLTSVVVHATVTFG